MQDQGTNDQPSRDAQASGSAPEAAPGSPRSCTLSRMAFPLGYFLTWGCYGRRLHGDDRGSFDDRNNKVDSPPIAPSRAWREWEAGIMTGSATVLNAPARRIVHDTIIAHCDIRAWQLHSHNVRTTHVHVVVSCGEIEPEPVMDQFKAWCTRGLRKARLAGQDATVWARHGSTRYLWTRQHIADAVAYVRDRQGPDLA
jgi:REP element-mobilizing transposase RayT